MSEQDEKIWVETMVASRTGEPAVVLRWYDHSGELTPQEARAFALQLLEAADGDAFLIKFLNMMSVGEPTQARMLNEFRKYRDGRNR